MKRYLIAIDSGGAHIRETLCVTHHGDTGEVTYDAKPYDGELPAWVMKKLASAQHRLHQTAGRRGSKKSKSVVPAAGKA
jgi:hypothetical protein